MSNDESRFVAVEVEPRRSRDVVLREVGSAQWRTLGPGERDNRTGWSNEELRAIGRGRHWINRRV
jgi:hypothetical protein